jgi:hypothetical protein
MSVETVKIELLSYTSHLGLEVGYEGLSKDFQNPSED